MTVAVQSPSRRHAHTLLLSGVVLCVFGATSNSDELFFILAAHAGSEQHWRLITAHLVHTDAVHLLANLGALVILALLLERLSPARLWIAVACGAAAVSLWFRLQTETDYYCGLSGVLCTLYVAVLTAYYQPEASCLTLSSANPAIVVLGALFVTKLLVEYHSAHRLADSGLWPSAPEAHLAGALAGLALFIAHRAFDHRLVIFQPTGNRVPTITRKTRDRAHRMYSTTVK